MPYRRLSFIAFALLIGGTFTACNGPKAISKRAVELHQAGFSEQAANLYYLALRKRPGYVDAMVGMKMSGQGTMDGWIGEFHQAAMDGRRADAINIYDEMAAFQSKIAKVGVDLVIPPGVEAQHMDLMDVHLVELLQEGYAQLDQDDFANAERTFREILRLDPQYPEAGELLNVARAEPAYRLGEMAMSEGRYREAHRQFSLVLAVDDGYKNAPRLSNEALSSGRFNLAVTAFESSSRDRDVALELRSGIQNGLLDSQDPFIGVVDRTLREDILAEQELSLSGISDEMVQVGELAGARAMLTGAILTFSSETSSPLSSPRNGFRKYFRQVKDEEGKIKKVAAYAPAQYTVHTQRRSVMLKFEVKLISTETGEVLLSEIEQVHAQDAVEFAVSQVQAGSLYPARSNGEVDRSGRSRMNALLGARRELAAESSLRAQVIMEATARGRRDIEQFLERHIE